MDGNPVFRGTRVPVHMLAELVPSRACARSATGGEVLCTKRRGSRWPAPRGGRARRNAIADMPGSHLVRGCAATPRARASGKPRPPLPASGGGGRMARINRPGMRRATGRCLRWPPVTTPCAAPSTRLMKTMRSRTSGTRHSLGKSILDKPKTSITNTSPVKSDFERSAKPGYSLALAVLTDGLFHYPPTTDNHYSRRLNFGIGSWPRTARQRSAGG